MGQAIDREHFDDSDYERFEIRLREELKRLAELLQRPGFGEGPESVGLELELNLIDEQARPLPKNLEVKQLAGDPRLALEINRFNLEFNSFPEPLRGAPFRALHAQVEEVMRKTQEAARRVSGKVLAIGILPTLQHRDLSSEVLTDQTRYRALSRSLRRLRREPFPVLIRGRDQLELTADDVTFEGANTSLQVHLKVPPTKFARYYNAAQLVAGPLLAACCNSPLLFGKRLWQETRVALFRQAVDERRAASEDDWRPARVTFGHGWVREGAYELFAESVALHEPLLPVTASEPENGVPQLDCLRLHHGTVWRWNRAVYDPAGGGHLRIELRMLPAGPSNLDVVANTAFAVGLLYGVAPELDTLLAGITFGHARRNFYEAAQHGLAAELVWPVTARGGPALVSAGQLLPMLLDRAEIGLSRAGVEPADARYWLGILRERVQSGTTGAVWQARLFDVLCREAGATPALRKLVARYRELADTGAPVHTWPSR